MTNRKVSIVNFDCDLEQSTTDALNIVKDFIQIGTILLFDDYNAFNANQNQGQRKSFSEFNEKSEFVFEKYFSYHYSGQSFLSTITTNNFLFCLIRAVLKPFFLNLKLIEGVA